jgi:hypothetical protein
MRVLQTEFLFDREQVDFDLDPPDYPAISCAWFKIEQADLAAPRSIVSRTIGAEGIMAFASTGFAVLVEKPTQRQIESFIDGCLYERIYEGDAEFEDVNNPRIVEYVLEQTMVIEESPPKAVPLKSLIGTGSVLSIGAMVGYSVTPNGFPLLLFITVPMGMIVIGSAAGIALGMQNGLHELVRKKFKEWMRKRD